jgi:hypothetical protein
MLYNCNAVSAARFQNAARDFKKHTALLQEMRKDVDNIFRRIRSIKAKISQQHPQAYAGNNGLNVECVVLELQSELSEVLKNL